MLVFKGFLAEKLLEHQRKCCRQETPWEVSLVPVPSLQRRVFGVLEGMEYVIRRKAVKAAAEKKRPGE